METIKEELSNVPVDPTTGFIQGRVLRLLQEHREDLEEELEAITTAKVEEERRECASSGSVQHKLMVAVAKNNFKLLQSPFTR